MLGCQSTGDPRKTTRGIWTPNALGGCAWPVPRPGGVWGPIASRRGFWFHSFPSGGSRLASGRRRACAPPSLPGVRALRWAVRHPLRPPALWAQTGQNRSELLRRPPPRSAGGRGAAARKCLCGRGEAAWCPEGRPGLSPRLASCLPLRSLGFLTYTLGPGPGGTTGRGGLPALLSGQGRRLCRGLSEGSLGGSGTGVDAAVRDWVGRL